MSATIKESLRSACRLMLRPVALLLLRGGMTWREFSELSKSVFVSVATDEFGINGRPTNISRVSILTGISRKEVKRQRDLLAEETLPTSSKTTDATRLLSGWFQDPDYRGADGRPLALPAEGPAPSFATLFASYGGDTPEQTLMKELRNAGSVEIDDAGRVVALRRFHTPGRLDEGGLRFFGTNLFDHARTLVDNVSGDEPSKWIERFAVDDRLREDTVEEFRGFVEQRGQQFLEEIDAWLARHRADADDPNATTARLGVGVYAIAGQLPKGTQS